MFFPRIIQSLRRLNASHAVAVMLVWVTACGGSSPTAPPPGLSVVCPSNQEASTIANAPVELRYPAPVASGGAQPVTVSCSPSPGARFPAGGSTVTCTAVDAAGATASCGFSVNVLNIPQLSKTRFMAFGDSLTEGKISLTPSLLVESGPQSYPAKLQKLLMERYTSQQITMLNEGFGGEKVSESFSRFGAALSTHHPEVLLLMHGVNDLTGEDGRVQTAANAVAELLAGARDQNVTAFVATLPPLGPPKAACPECVVPYNNLIREIAGRRGATLVDVYQVWRPELMGADGIHPTEAGYDVIAHAFFEAIRRTLEDHSSTP